MNKSETDLDIISPDILDKKANIRAWFTLKNLSYDPVDQLIPGLNLGLNTPENKSLIKRNRTTLYEALNIDPEHVATAEQVHSNKIEEVTKGGNYLATDGFISRIPKLTLAVQVADCAVVLLWDEFNNIVAALHAGWRGARADIVPLGIRRMVRLGAESHRLKAFITPCISEANFEVGNRVAEQFPNQFVDYGHYKKPHIDLKGFLKFQLLNEDLSESNIEVRPECTVAGADKFYSYRREGNQSGRMMALIQINNL